MGDVLHNGRMPKHPAYLLSIDLDKRSVRVIGNNPPPNHPAFSTDVSPRFDLTVYRVLADAVEIETHWLSSTPIFFRRNGARVFAANSLADLAQVSHLQTDTQRLSALIHQKRTDGPGDPQFADITVAHPGDTIRITFADGGVHISALQDERTAACTPLPESQIEDALVASLERRIAGASKLAFAISGGVDSTTLAALGSRLFSGQPILCFTARTHGGSDLPFAIQAARDIGADLRIVDVPVDASALALHSAAVSAACHPIAFSGNSIGFAAICRAARAEGVDVIVDGTGSAPLFGGGYMLHGIYWARAEGLDRSSQQFAEFIEAAKAMGHFSQEDIAKLTAEPTERIDYGLKMRREMTRGGMARWRSHHIANARAHDIRIAMPYLDDDVARFVWHEPTAYFQKGWNKAPLRRVLERYVSSEVAWRRSEQGLRWPVRPFLSKNRFAMSQYIAGSRIRSVSLGYWAAGALGVLPAARLGRLYSTAHAHDSALEAYTQGQYRG